MSLKSTITLPGVKGRIDHMAYDRNGQRVFICALGNNSVEIVDVKNDKPLYSIKNILEPQGIVFDSARKMIAVSSGEEGWLKFYNSETYHCYDSIMIGSDADNVRFDNDHTIYVGYDGGIAMVDLGKMKKSGNLETDGHVESFQIDLKKKKLFANVPDAYETEVYDLNKPATPVAKWKTADAKDNFPMALDTTTHRVFIACRHPSQILAMDENSGKIISTIDCSGDADDIYYDPGLHLLLGSCGEAYIDAFSDSSSVFTRVAQVPTHFQARTSLYLPAEKRFFLAVPAMPGKTAELEIYDLK